MIPTPFEGSMFAALAGAYLIFALLLLVIILVASWKIFIKAERPGWALLIPFYNIYVFTQILCRPKWWVVLYFFGIVPFAGSFAVLFVSVVDSIRLAKLFGKTPAFGVGLILLPFIFYLILAFGNATYCEHNVVEGELI
tara:strand:+ start:6233 stop:6649 length:417 start_codon:yes stop_codon:yes gene_type:complete